MAETDGVFDFVYDSHCVCFDVVMVDCLVLRFRGAPGQCGLSEAQAYS